MLLDHFKRHNMEYQFWCYETGNVIAAIAGSGGFSAFVQNLSGVFNDATLSSIGKIQALTSNYPDATAALGIATVVLAAPFARKAAQRISAKALNVTDAALTAGSAGILGYAIGNDASLITTSASSFVLGSAFLRQSGSNPFFLKLGGLGLAGGGAFLAAFGVENGMKDLRAEHVEAARCAMDCLTAATGVYVTSASFLTYEGGIYATKDFEAAQKENEPSQEEHAQSWVSKLTHPTKGSLAKFFASKVDKPIQALNEAARKSILRYIPKKIRNSQPFYTSMWARLPWRAALGAAAVVNGNPAFAVSNALWGGGDVMIGLEDSKKKGGAPEIAASEAAPH